MLVIKLDTDIATNRKTIQSWYFINRKNIATLPKSEYDLLLSENKVPLEFYTSSNAFYLDENDELINSYGVFK